METGKKRNTSVDLFKLIFAFCVIGIHVDLFKDVSPPAFRTLTEGLFRIGVPFYFLVSGYFFADKLNDREKSDAYLKRLLKIYLIFEIIDIVFTLPALRLSAGEVILRFFTTGLNRIYWYMVSLILTCFLFRGLWRKGYVLPLMAAGFALYLVSMTYDSYSFLFENTFPAKIGEAHRFVWAWPQAGFGESLFFLSAGIYLKQKQPVIRHLNLLLCISLAGLVIEGNFCQLHGAADANCYFFLIPASIFLFLFTLEHPSLPAPAHAGDMSLYMYMTHVWFSYLSWAVSPNSVGRFLFTALMAALVSILIIHIKARRKKRL